MKSGAPGPKALVEKLKAAAATEKVFAQAFDPSAIVSERQLASAFLLAKKSFENGGSRSKTLEAEVLAKAAATPRLEEAIPKVGVKSAKEFILFTTAKGKKLERLLEEIGATAKKPGFKPDKKKICALYKIDGKLLKDYSLEELVLEQVALSGIGK
ncbi:Kinase binding protein CGI-121 [uncultured archaeon]|nr:Kinase binding protein CGI-121 [uncultured archaeon]